MVLRKDRSPSVGASKSTMSSNEQPVSKRQRIDNRISREQPSSASVVAAAASNQSVAELAASKLNTGSSSEISNRNNNETVPISKDETDKSAASSSEVPDLLKTVQTASLNNVMIEFEEYLTKQCLCDVSENTLRKPFESHYSEDTNGAKRVANLREWPRHKLLQFLSNLQLLFDVYLKQNRKGFICSRIMDVCDALIRNDHNLIDGIIDLVNTKNKYVQYLAGRVLTSFLVIAKNNMDDNWLKKLVDNLFLFERLDVVAVQKMHFSLEIIKRIVEWKDVTQHPLEDEIDNSSTTSYQPTIENNYFAASLGAEIPSTSASGPSSSAPNQIHRNETGCQLVTLTDSESFDTTHLKCVTIKILENKWPALVKNMSLLISGGLIGTQNAENCVLTFLYLWENIISVQANLSIVETLPFYSQLDKFELLLNPDMSCTIYNQMLSLFNEALCYGSTLALQDLLPDETCLLAHQILRHVKDSRILDSLPRNRPDNAISFIGFKGASITYEDGTLENFSNMQTEEDTSQIQMNKTILQKMLLLVLKSVAVTVKEIRCDSSDSSIDSTDYEAFQDTVLIERSIRDVMNKLEIFIKTTLELLPEWHFSQILIHVFGDQDDYLIEAMLCTLDVTAGISFGNNAFPELVSILNPVFTFLEFLKMIPAGSERDDDHSDPDDGSPDRSQANSRRVDENSARVYLFLDLLINNETCFLLYLLRFLKYIRSNWSMFVSSCHRMGANTLEEAMDVLINLRLHISRLVSKSLYPYDISPVLRLLENCESLYEGNELS